MFKTYPFSQARRPNTFNAWLPINGPGNVSPYEIEYQTSHHETESSICALVTTSRQRTASRSRISISNAVLERHLLPARLFYDYLVEEGQRESNPVGRGRYTAGKGFGGKRAKGLVPHFTKLPWIPT